MTNPDIKAFLQAALDQTADAPLEGTHGETFHPRLSADGLRYSMGRLTATVPARLDIANNRVVLLTPELAAAEMAAALAMVGMGNIPMPTQPAPTFNPEVSGTAGDGQTLWRQEFAAGDHYFRLELSAERFVRVAADGFESLELIGTDGVSLQFQGASPMAVSRLLEPGTYYVKAATSTARSTPIQITVATPTSLPTPAVNLAEGEAAAWYIPQFTSGGGELVLSGQTDATATLGNPARNEEIPLYPGTTRALPWAQPVDLLLTLLGPGTGVSVQNILPR